VAGPAEEKILVHEVEVRKGEVYVKPSSTQKVERAKKNTDKEPQKAA
jgi:hypothetical protein